MPFVKSLEDRDLREDQGSALSVLDFLVPAFEGGTKLYYAAQCLGIDEIYRFAQYSSSDLIEMGARPQDVSALELALRSSGVSLLDTQKRRADEWVKLGKKRRFYRKTTFDVKKDEKDAVCVNGVTIPVPKTGRHTLTQDKIYLIYNSFRKNHDLDKTSEIVGVTRNTIQEYLNKAGVLMTKKELIANGLLLD